MLLKSPPSPLNGTWRRYGLPWATSSLAQVRARGLVRQWQLPPSDNRRRWVTTTVSTDEHTPRSADKPMLKALAGLIAATAAADLDEINARAMVPLLFLVVSILGRSLGVIPGTDPVSAGASVSIVPVDLPPGAGIGSSAALCVAAAGALLGAVCDSTAADGDTGAEGAGAAGWAPQEALQRLINEWAFMGEQVIHGNPSGLDNTVSCFGGAMAYAKEPKVRACGSRADVPWWQLPQLWCDRSHSGIRSGSDNMQRGGWRP